MSEVSEHAKRAAEQLDVTQNPHIWLVEHAELVIQQAIDAAVRDANVDRQRLLALILRANRQLGTLRCGDPRFCEICRLRDDIEQEALSE